MDKERFALIDESCLPQMAELFRAAFSGEPWNDDWSDNEQLTSYIRDLACCFNSLNYGLFIGDKLAAMAVGSIRHWWEGTNYNLEELCVAPEFRSQGIGTRFLSLIEEDIASRGLSGIFLQTDSGKPAYDFYRKNGFSELRTHVSFYKSLKQQ